MANLLTSIRIACGLLLLLFPAFSGWYYLLYLTGGLTDAIDGTVARKLGQETDFGAKYDTAADFIFAVAVLIRIMSAVHFPSWLLIWICLIFAVKVAGLLLGLLRYRRLVAVHSALNKVCGVAVFLPPLFIGGDYAWQAKALILILVCLLASVAAIDECRKIWNGKDAA